MALSLLCTFVAHITFLHVFFLPPPFILSLSLAFSFSLSLFLSLSLFISAPSFSLWLQDTCHLMISDALYQIFSSWSILLFHTISFHSSYKIHQLFTDYLLRLPSSEPRTIPTMSPSTGSKTIAWRQRFKTHFAPKSIIIHFCAGPAFTEQSPSFQIPKNAPQVRNKSEWMTTRFQILQLILQIRQWNFLARLFIASQIQKPKSKPWDQHVLSVPGITQLPIPKLQH